MKCLNCGKTLVKGQNKYCSNKCQKDFEYKQYIQRWKNGLETGLIGQYGISSHIRRYLLEKYNNKCQKCGWGEQNIYTNSIPLEVHHKDGDYRNNQEDNLELLCPNCHSLTENYKSANRKGREGREKYSNRKNYCIDCGIEINSTSIRCKSCAGKINNHSDKKLERDELKKRIRVQPFTQIGKDCNVTDNAVRKWCDSYNLPRTKKEINSYSDEEWEKI